MTIQYTVSEYVWARYGHAMARRRGEPYSRQRYYWMAIWPIVLGGLGTFSAFSALSSGRSPVFLVIGILLAIEPLRNLVGLRSHQRAIEDTFFPRHLDRVGIRVSLEISDTGIREWRGDVVLSAGLSNIVSTHADDDLLVISLDGLRRIVIPRTSPGNPDIDLESLRTTIDRLRGHPQHSRNSPENALKTINDHSIPG